MSLAESSDDNPFQGLITDTDNSPAELQSRYESHRVNRNDQQKAKILSENFEGWAIDPILRRLDDPEKEEDYLDPRNCLCIWARPSSSVRELISSIQSELKEVAPSIWLMPPDCLHTTVLEVAHSLPEEQIASLVESLQSSKQITPKQISQYATHHQSRLVKPMVSFDSSALALSFVPAINETLDGSGDKNYYSYHHLRRDVFDMVRQANIHVASRYMVPSAHVTIARFINHDGFLKDGVGNFDKERVKSFIDRVEDINQRLESIPAQQGVEWVIGKEQGLVIRRGRLWYGGGQDMQFD